ncbi:MAG: RagB/SusD family nutrient uptake outer membrane protein [Bacteroidales bacterium]|nr:RagB/SusD family nutrient uptake outer membrane protein [Bacteroidales bacterium]
MKKVLFTLITMLPLFTSCSDDDLYEGPVESVTSELLLSNEEGAESVLIGLYKPTFDIKWSYFAVEYYGTGSWMSPQGNAPEGIVLKNLWHNASTPILNKFWERSIDKAAKCSGFIIDLQDIDFKSEQRKKEAEGEARFCRALNLFVLVERYGVFQ